MNWPHNFIAEDQLISLTGENDQKVLSEEI